MTREFEKLKYSDPVVILPQLRKIQELTSSSNLSENIKNLRTNRLKKYREGCEAAIFAYGMGLLLQTKVFVSIHEAADYDVVTMRRDKEEILFTPIQIKELVPLTLNPYTDLNSEIRKLSKYTDVCVALHLNRLGRLDLSKLKIPKLKISQLWLFGASTPDKRRWFVAGDILNNPGISEFYYPFQYNEALGRP